MVSAHFLRTFYDRAIIFHVLIDFGGDMTPLDFEFIILKGTVTRVTFVKIANVGLNHYSEN